MKSTNKYSYKQLNTRVPVETIVKIKPNNQSIKENLKGVNNKISIIDNNNRLMEEFTAAKIFSSTSNNRNLFESSLMKYVDLTIKGHNLLILCLGTTGSGKETIFSGNKSEPGLVSIFTQNLFASIELAASNKNTNSESMQFNIKFRLVQLLNEKIIDLISENRYTQLEIIQENWEGVKIDNARWVDFQNFNDARDKIENTFKERAANLNELGQDMGKSAIFLTIQLTQKFFSKQGFNNNIVSRITFCELPGFQVLKSNQQQVRIRQDNLSIKGIINFISLIKQLAQNNQAAPLYEASKITYLLKDYLGGNAYAVAILTVANGDPQGTIKTLRNIKNLNMISQYPIFNNGQSIGLLHKFRLQNTKGQAQTQYLSNNNNIQTEKQIIESNLAKIRSEDDYRRIVEKYAELRRMYNDCMKKRADIQFELIKSEEQKLEISKTLVESQIENTKLLEQLQNKDYQIGRKMIKAQTSMIQKEVANSKNSERIRQLEQSLSEAIDGKRELQVQFIALKKNFIMNQKQIQDLKKKNESLGLEVINLSNEKKYLNEQFSKNLKKSGSGDNPYYLEQIQKLKKQNQKLIENQKFLKSEVERYRKDAVKYQLSLKQNNIDIKRSNVSSSSYRKTQQNGFDNLELQNQNIQLNNKIKLLNRKIDQLNQNIVNLTEDNNQIHEMNQKLIETDNANTQNYRSKLIQIAKTIDAQSPITELSANFNAAEKKSKTKITELNKKLIEKKQQIRNLITYARQLKYLAEEWAPKSIDLPELLTNPKLQLTIHQSQNSQFEILKSKNKQLEQQLTQLRNLSRNVDNRSNISNQRIQQEINFLKGSRTRTNNMTDVQLIRKQRNDLKEENRKLLTMLKDGNKIETTTLVKQNEQLKRQIQNLKAKESISPNSNDQKLIYYEKHLKKLQKQRSQLLVRCTMAQQQLKSFQEYYEKKKK